MTGVLEAAFTDPVFESQTTFRALMEALARPGTQQAVQPTVRPPHPLTAELAILALTLCDHDTTVWLDEALAGSAAVREWMDFHVGAPLAAAPQEAAFALATYAKALPPLERFQMGTDEYPDRSATIVLCVPALAGGKQFTCRGPGIEDEIVVSPQGLPPDFLEQWSVNHGRFPRGVDVLLVGPGAVIGLPRTTRLEG